MNKKTVENFEKCVMYQTCPCLIVRSRSIKMFDLLHRNFFISKNLFLGKINTFFALLTSTQNIVYHLFRLNEFCIQMYIFKINVN